MTHYRIPIDEVKTNITHSLESMIHDASDLTSIVKALPTDLQLKLSRALGETVSTQIYDDAISVNHDYHMPEKLLDPSAETWISNRNSVVSEFVKSAVQSVSASEKTSKAIYAQAKAVDSIYKARYTNFVSTLSFAENITLYSITGSKAAVNMCSSSSSGGGMSTILAWLKSRTKANPVIFPGDGDLFVAIDNEQVVGKTWRVYANRKVPTSIVTSVIAMRLPSNEQKEFLIPSVFSKQYSDDGLDFATSDSHPTSFKTAHDELKKFLRQRIAILIDEQRATLEGWTDTIEEEIKKPIWCRKKCSKCGQQQDVLKNLEDKETPAQKSSKPTCKKRGSKNMKNVSDVQGELFANRKSNAKKQCSFRIEAESFPSLRSAKKQNCANESNTSALKIQEAELHVIDPAFVNPNSYETITLVLRHVGRSAGIAKYGSGERKWVFVTMDGLPYTMAYAIVQQTYTCRLCQVSIFGNEDLVKHNNEHHEDGTAVDREFDWVVLRIGAGHYEMNMKKSFMELNFIPFMSDISAQLGFQSVCAQNFVKNCSDNHKTWDLLCITRNAVADELLRPYVVMCLMDKVPCTTSGYFKFCTKNVHNDNYKYLYEQIFVYLQAIFNYRMALRENQHDLLLAGKIKFSPLWFVRNHPKYQHIDISDSHDRYCYPDNASKLVQNNESFSFTGNPGTGEGLDFVLENVNKKVKSILPHGIPNADDWLLAFRNYHDLDNIRSATFKRMGITDPSSVASTKQRNYYEEIRICRTLIRKSGILNNPQGESEFRSLAGKKLHKDLLSLSSRGEKNKKIYVEHLKSKKKGSKELQYVIVNEEELTVKSRQVTKSSLVATIKNKLHHMSYGVTSDFLTGQWKEVKKGNKAGIIDFLKVVEDAEVVAEISDVNQG